MFFEVGFAIDPNWTFYAGEITAMDRGFDITASPSTDVVGYQVTLTGDGGFTESVDYNDDAQIAHPTDINKRRFDLASDPRWPNLDGTFQVQVRAIDDAGNTSAGLPGEISIDFVEPDPPSDFTVF